MGKTQLGMQLALDVQMPAAFSGLGGTAVYIDTGGIGAGVPQAVWFSRHAAAKMLAAVQPLHRLARPLWHHPPPGLTTYPTNKPLTCAAEGSFMLDRFTQMADAFLAHLRRAAHNKQNAAWQAAAAGLTREALLEGVHYFRIRDHVEQVRGAPCVWGEGCVRCAMLRDGGRAAVGGARVM